MSKDYKTRGESDAILTNLIKCEGLQYPVAEISNTKRKYKVKKPRSPSKISKPKYIY